MTAQTKQDESGAAPLVKGPPSDAHQSRHLWVGNVSSSLTEVVLVEQFSRFGDVESVMVYSSRNYAFVNFKSLEDAVYAKKGLQGAVLGGFAIRIEFAKGAKPSRHLWIGNISSSVTKEELEAEFTRFGVLESLRFLRDLNCAFVDFIKMDDAICAYESLNRKKLGNKELHIEFERSSLQSRKDCKFEAEPKLDERMEPADVQIPTSNGGKKISEKSKGDKDIEPTEVLWIGFPMYMKVDERKLHKAFTPFGVIERITTFPGRTYAFVKFQNAQQASKAKNALQGNLFNDPRVSVTFAKSEVGLLNHSRGIDTFPSPLAVKVEQNPIIPVSKAGSLTNPRNDRFSGFNTFRPSSPSFGTKSGVDMNQVNLSFQGPDYELEPYLSINTGLERGLRPGYKHGLKFKEESSGSPAVPERIFLHSNQMVIEDQDQCSNLEERGGKRQRVGGHTGDGGLPQVALSEVTRDRQPFQMVKTHEYISNVTRLNGSDSYQEERWDAQKGMKRALQEGMPLPGSGSNHLRAIKGDWIIPGVPVVPPKDGFQWQGIISKSGTLICHAQCFPVSDIVDVPFPEVVNCTARTHLDMLAKHISQASDFSVVSFVPRGQEDVRPYQDFIVYLSEKKRAAVCKLSLESTLFLVPPSKLVEQFLRVFVSDSIFGIILKLQPLPHQSSPVLAEQGIPQCMQARRLLPVHELMDERFYNLGLQAPPKNQLSESLSMHLPSNDVSLTATITSQPLQQQHSSLQSSLAGNFGVMSGGLTDALSNDSVGFNNPIGQGFILDNKRAHQPERYPLMQPNQHDAMRIDSASCASNVQLQSHQEHGMPSYPKIGVPFPGQLASSHADGNAATAEDHDQKKAKISSENLPGSTQYQQQPPPALFSPSNIKTSKPDQLSQIISLPAHQQESFPNVMQILQRNLQHHLPLDTEQHHVQQRTSVSNSPLISESFCTTGMPRSQALGKQFQGEGQVIKSVAEQQCEVLQTAQQKPSAESHTKRDTDENQKRFQATLELAAALLEQLQKQTKA